MIRKIVSVFLLLIILIGTTPIASANTNQAAREAQCSASSQTFSTNLLTFMVENLLWGVGFLALDATTSLLETITVFGFKLGGVIEPIEQAIGFIRNAWMEAVVWGITASLFNWIAGSLIEAGIALNLTLNAGNPLVSYGGRIILQIVNLGLVISIIFIGIATILRLKQGAFSADKLLIKLIIGIVFVNLTIPAVTSIANMGTIVTDVMYRNSAPCPVNMTHQFTAWGLQRRFYSLLTGGDINKEPIQGTDNIFAHTEFDAFLQDPELTSRERRNLERQRNLAGGQASAFTGMLGSLTASLLSIIAGSAMSFIAALTFLALAIFLIIRFVVLMLLITFSPLIWLGFIFSDFKIPGFGNAWSGWWSQFLKWTFFGPVIVLFIAFVSEYLYSIDANPIILPGSPGFTQNFIQIAQLLVVLAISAIGLYATNKFSGAAGGMVMQAASGGLGFIANRAQGVLKKAQLGAEMRAKEEELKGNIGKAKAFKILSKAHQATGTGFSLSKSSSLLGRAGIKPVIKAPDEAKIKKGILEEKVKESKYGTPKPVTGFSIGAGYQPSIAGVPITDKPSAGFKFKKGYVEDPTKVLAISEKDAQNLSDDSKKAFVSAIRETQKISSSLTPKERASLRKHEKAFASDLATATMKDVEVPTTLTFGKAMTPSDLDKAKNMLQLAQESIRDIVNNGTVDIIEKGAKTILALESELIASPSSFNRDELNKLQLLRRNFDEKITDYIVDNFDDSSTGLANPDNLKTVLNLSNKNLSYISKSGTNSDKKKIDDALTHLVGHVTTPTEIAERTRIDTKVNVLKGKNEWL